MSTLRSGLDELRAEDLRHASDAALEGDLGELERASRILEAERARRIAEVERRRSFERDGYLSTSAWLTHRLRIAWSVATQQVRVARSLDRMRETRRALSDGEISASAASVLVGAREACPAAFPHAETVLVEAARTLSVRDLGAAVGYWRQAADAPGAAREAERLLELRRLHVSTTLAGMVRVDGDLDPETGQTVVAALRALEDADVRRPVETRTPAQRRADALGEICRRWLDRGDRPTVAGERPHLNVTVDLEALEGRAGVRCELDDAGAVPPEAARRLACDAAVSRVITRGRCEPLDVGRRTQVVPAAIRRAVVVRDRRCRFPGCDRPHTWCDAHHVAHWADGGETALSNLVLLCRPHHRMVHERFGLELVDGEPVFLRPDGSRLEDLGPPWTG